MKHVIVLALFVAFGAMAEEETATSQTTAETPTDAKVVGRVDLRPTYVGKSSTDAAWDYHTENYAELGYQFNPNSVLSYRQEFNTNLFNPRDTVNGGFDPVAKGGFIRGQLKDLWVSDSKDWSLSYEARAYLPTDAAKRDAGQITQIRNYGILTHKFSDSASLSFLEAPVVHMYDRAGVGAAANPSFENRVYLDGVFNLTDSLTFEMQLILYSTRFRNFAAGAKNNNAWDHNLWLYPEVLYTINPTYTVGIAYNSDYLMTPDLAKFQVGDGLEKGLYQLVFIANL